MRKAIQPTWVFDVNTSLDIHRVRDYFRDNVCAADKLIVLDRGTAI